MNGYRILVSNLQSSVTAADIHVLRNIVFPYKNKMSTINVIFQELFGDIGELTDSKLVRPGTAEVIYSSLKDAQKAVDVYHNRQLDGQPMNCFLVNPRKPSTAPSRPPPSKNG